MTAIDTKVSCLRTNMKSSVHHVDYPDKPGLYAFQLAQHASLRAFGKGGRIIYVGKAEDSLKRRDLHTHFKDNCTGGSTLRRSVGAILKEELEAVAFSRNGTPAQYR